MDPRHDPAMLRRPTGVPSRPSAGGPAEAADDGLLRLAGWVLVAVLTLLAAAVAAVVYGVAMWRRWRWWTLALTGAGGALLVVVVSGPAEAFNRHLLAMRELSDTAGRPVADLVLERWPAWALAQLPLAVPLGVVLAAFARHQVTCVPAHELSPGAQHRRKAEEAAKVRDAVRRSASAPVNAHGEPVLGAWVDGDLDGWRHGRWCVIPERSLGLGTLLVGLPGAGKTETLLRLAQLGLHAGWDVHVIDAKGDRATQDRFATLAAAIGVDVRLFPQDSYDGFRGEPAAVRNRLARIVDYSEPYYQDGARVLLHAACNRTVQNLEDLMVRLESAGDVDPTVRKGTVSRYRSFAGAVGNSLSGNWAFEDTRASYVLLDGLGLGDDTPRLARFLLEDFAHFASARKDPDRKVLLLVDEFSALRVANAAALFERLRSFGAGVVLAAQSIEGLHDEPSERDRLFNSASTLIAHRVADPEPIGFRAGTVRRAERSHQLAPAGPTGEGSLRIQDTYRIDLNDLRSLPAGVAWVTTGGRAAKVAVTQAGVAATRRRHASPGFSARLEIPGASAPAGDDTQKTEVRISMAAQAGSTAATADPAVSSTVTASAPIDTGLPVSASDSAQLRLPVPNPLPAATAAPPVATPPSIQDVPPILGPQVAPTAARPVPPSDPLAGQCTLPFDQPAPASSSAGAPPAAEGASRAEAAPADEAPPPAGPLRATPPRDEGELPAEPPATPPAPPPSDGPNPNRRPWSPYATVTPAEPRRSIPPTQTPSPNLTPPAIPSSFRPPSLPDVPPEGRQSSAQTEPGGTRGSSPE